MWANGAYAVLLAWFITFLLETRHLSRILWIRKTEPRIGRIIGYSEPGFRNRSGLPIVHFEVDGRPTECIAYSPDGMSRQVYPVGSEVVVRYFPTLFGRKRRWIVEVFDVNSVRPPDLRTDGLLSFICLGSAGLLTVYWMIATFFIG
jgi:hypothetical protein